MAAVLSSKSGDWAIRLVVDDREISKSVRLILLPQFWIVGVGTRQEFAPACWCGNAGGGQGECGLCQMADGVWLELVAGWPVASGALLSASRSNFNWASSSCAPANQPPRETLKPFPQSALRDRNRR